MDEQELNYRPVNNAAILGFLLALMSGASLAFFAVWPLCLVALVVCWNASRTIAKNSDHMTGRSFALIGIFMAILFCVGAFVKSNTSGRLHQADVDLVAEQFVDYLVDKDYLNACELMLPFKERQPSEKHLVAHYEHDANAIEKLRSFKEREAFKRVDDLKDPEYSVVKSYDLQTLKHARYASARSYDIVSKSDGSSGKMVKIIVHLERTSSRLPNPVCWRVKMFDLDR